MILLSADGQNVFLQHRNAPTLQPHPRVRQVNHEPRRRIQGLNCRYDRVRANDLDCRDSSFVHHTYPGKDGNFRLGGGGSTVAAVLRESLRDYQRQQQYEPNNLDARS